MYHLINLTLCAQRGHNDWILEVVEMNWLITLLQRIDKNSLEENSMENDYGGICLTVGK